ncbi:MAG: hypothetical protein IJM44_03970 [Ruminococcus sp.]|nr:hypothetical protein [Ruminococcus sp.]
MMNKLRITALLAAMLMAFSTYGCGDTDEGDDTDGTGKSSSASDEDDGDEDDEEEETTKRTRKKRSEDEETTEEETEEETEETTEEETEPETEATTEAPAVSASGEFVMVPGVELRMTLDEIKTALGDKAAELEYLYDGYDCECYAFPVDGALGVDIKGNCFFDINRDSGKLQTYGYHFGETGDMADPDYTYSEAELKAGYDTLITQLIASYGGAVSDEGQYEGIKKWYEEVLPDGDEIWAVYGIDMWGEGSGINEITVSMSIPFEERGE